MSRYSTILTAGMERKITKNKKTYDDKKWLLRNLPS